jgi:hypothetical protein
MKAVVDQVLSTYGTIRKLDPDALKESREKIVGYFEKLASAGQTDAEQLSVYGLAYLQELHEGPDPRFTGC